MAEAAGDATELLKTLASPHRLMIVCHLIDREHSVGELAEALELRDSTVSQHLAVLRRERVVQTRRDGQTIWYALASPPARAVLETLYRFYCEPRRHPVPRKQPKARAAMTEINDRRARFP